MPIVTIPAGQLLALPEGSDPVDADLLAEAIDAYGVGPIASLVRAASRFALSPDVVDPVCGVPLKRGDGFCPNPKARCRVHMPDGSLKRARSKAPASPVGGVEAPVTPSAPETASVVAEAETKPPRGVVGAKPRSGYAPTPPVDCDTCGARTAADEELCDACIEARMALEVEARTPKPDPVQPCPHCGDEQVRVVWEPGLGWAMVCRCGWLAKAGV